MVSLVEIVKEDGRYRLKEFYVNPDWILSITEEPPNQEVIKESQAIGIAPQAKYSRVIISAGYSEPRQHVVVGDPGSLSRKIKNRGLLKG